MRHARAGGHAHDTPSRAPPRGRVVVVDLTHAASAGQPCDGPDRPGGQPDRQHERRGGTPLRPGGWPGRGARDRRLLRARRSGRDDRPTGALDRPAAAVLPGQASGRPSAVRRRPHRRPAHGARVPRASPASFIRATRGWCRRTTSSSSRSIGCPDPDPTYTRFFTPERGGIALPTSTTSGVDTSALLADEIAKWLAVSTRIRAARSRSASRSRVASTAGRSSCDVPRDAAPRPLAGAAQGVRPEPG